MDKLTATTNLTTINVTVKLGIEIIHSKSYSSFPIVFGRGSQCDIAFPQIDFLSRNHGVISVEKGKIKITDLRSTNGISQNNQKLMVIEVEEKGSFQAGKLTFEVEFINKRMNTNSTLSDRQPYPNNALKNLNSPLDNNRPQEFDESEAFTVNWDPEVQNLQIDDMSLQCIITWDNETYDVRNFTPGEEIVIGPKFDDAVWLPILSKPIRLGHFQGNGAVLYLNKGIPFEFSRRDLKFGPKELVAEKIVSDAGKRVQISFQPTDIFSVDLGFGLVLHLKFVQIPRPLIKRQWIDNKEEFKKAISVSGILHLIFAVISLMAVPKSDAPKIENVPPRFAKLLIDPPKQILAPPPPLFEEPPKVEEPPKIEEKPIEPPKMIVDEKPKPKVKPKVKPEPKKIAKKEPEKPLPKKSKLDEIDLPKDWPEATEKTIVKSQPNKPQVDQQAIQRQAQEVARQKAAAQEVARQEAIRAEEQKNQAEMANIFSTLPGSGSGNTAPSNMKIAKGNTAVGAGGAGGGGIQTGGVLKNFKGQGGMDKLMAGGSGPSIGSEVGQTGYSKSGLSGKAGKRSVGGAVMGTPSFKGVVGKQGLDNEQVMKIVNQRLGDIHRCYERALFQDSNLVGRIEYEWEINQSGSVTSINVKRSDIANAEALNDCVMNVFRSMKFPKSTNGETTTANVGFPFGKN